MPYQQEISRANKALVFFLIDQSYSMEEPLGNSANRKMDELATVLNNWLYNMVIRATGSEGIKDLMDVGVLGYCTDDDANPIMETAFANPLLEQLTKSNRLLASVSEIGNSISRMETRTQKFFDEELGSVQETQKEVPIWVEAKAAGGTPMCNALHKTHEIVSGWINDHSRSYPPIVIHITDGESQDGDAKPYAEAIKSLATEDGNVLLFNCHLSMAKADPIRFPHSDEIVPDPFARDLFQMSSQLPEKMAAVAQAEGFDLKPGARGMFFNSDGVELIKFLDIGTRVASNLR